MINRDFERKPAWKLEKGERKKEILGCLLLGCFSAVGQTRCQRSRMMLHRRRTSALFALYWSAPRQRVCLLFANSTATLQLAKFTIIVTWLHLTTHQTVEIIGTQAYLHLAAKEIYISDRRIFRGATSSESSSGR